MDDLSESVGASDASVDEPSESGFRAGMFVSAIAIALFGGALMMVFIVLRGMSHSFNSRADDPWWYAGVALQLLAGWLFTTVGARARRVPPTRRSGLVVAGGIVSYLLAAATFLLSLWALAMIWFA
jgi:hypothetical protein